MTKSLVAASIAQEEDADSSSSEPEEEMTDSAAAGPTVPSQQLRTTRRMTEEADASSSEPEEREIATPVRCRRTLEFSGAAQQPQQPQLPPLAASGPPRGGAEPFSLQYFLSSGSGVIRQPQQPQQPFSMQPSAQQREPQQPFSMQPGPQQHEPQQHEPQQPFSMPFLDSLRENVPEPDMSYNKKPQSSGLVPPPHWAPHDRMFTGKGKSCKGGQGGEGDGPVPDGADSPASHSQIGAQQQPPVDGQHGKGNGKHGKDNCVDFTAAHQPF